MDMSTQRPYMALLLLAILLIGMAGCSRYDSLERNMQYVSLDMLRDESVVAYERVKSAQKTWQASQQQDTLENFKKMYLQYAIIYNELMDRETPRRGRHLAAFAGALPPPPPGLKTPSETIAKPESPVEAAPAVVPGPSGRDLKDAIDTQESSSTAMPAATQRETPPAVQTTTLASSSGDHYVVRSGDTPHRIAQQLHVSEARLLEVNSISAPEKLQIGRQLVIPGNAADAASSDR